MIKAEQMDQELVNQVKSGEVEVKSLTPEQVSFVTREMTNDLDRPAVQKKDEEVKTIEDEPQEPSKDGKSTEPKTLKEALYKKSNEANTWRQRYEANAKRIADQEQAISGLNKAFEDLKKSTPTTEVQDMKNVLQELLASQKAEKERQYERERLEQTFDEIKELQELAGEFKTKTPVEEIDSKFSKLYSEHGDEWSKLITDKDFASSKGISISDDDKRYFDILNLREEKAKGKYPSLRAAYRDLYADNKAKPATIRREEESHDDVPLLDGGGNGGSLNDLTSDQVQSKIAYLASKKNWSSDDYSLHEQLKESLLAPLG